MVLLRVDRVRCLLFVVCHSLVLIVGCCLLVVVVCCLCVCVGSLRGVRRPLVMFVVRRRCSLLFVVLLSVCCWLLFVVC